MADRTRSEAAVQRRYTRIRIVPLEGESYDIGEGDETLCLMQAKSGQYIQSSFHYTPEVVYPKSQVRDLQPQCLKTPIAKKFKGDHLGTD